MNDNLQPYELGTWIRIYTNALMMECSTMIGQVTSYGKCDFGSTVTVKNRQGGCEVPLGYVIGPVKVNIQDLEANLPVVQHGILNITDLAPCVVPLLEVPVVAVIRPDQEWWSVREGKESWRTRSIVTQGIPVSLKRALGFFPEFKQIDLIYKEH